jgi:hypothetical protein
VAARLLALVRTSLIALALSVGACAGLPIPLENPGTGEGWRLLASGNSRATGRAYQVQVATTDADWQVLWRTFDPVNAPPTVDWASEIAVTFSEGIGSTCPERRLDAVVIDPVERLVYSVTSDPLAHQMCTDDLVGVADFMVALSRASLPQSPFTVRLKSKCIGPCDGGEEVTVDLAP